jgi:hypothetical protein
MKKLKRSDHIINQIKENANVYVLLFSDEVSYINVYSKSIFNSRLYNNLFYYR